MTAAGMRLAIAKPPISAVAAAAIAQTEGADLLLLPSHDPKLPEPSDGELAHFLGDLAEAHDVALLYAYTEVCSGLVHPAVQLVQTDGRATANYRATHLTAATLTDGLAPGNWLTMAQFGEVALGLLAGADHLAPEVARSLSAMQSEVLLGLVEPAPGIDTELFEALMRLRAIENGIAVCLATATDVAAADATGSLLPLRSIDDVAIIDLPLVDRPAAAPRRPELYRRLVAIG